MSHNLLKWSSSFLGIVLATVFISCGSKSKQDQAATERSANWQGQMQNMAQDVRKLLPYLYDREAFKKPENRTEILSNLKQFSKAAQHVEGQQGKLFLGDDLLVEYSLNNLREDLNRAVHSFEIGQLEYSRSVAKASLNHCFRCHSVTEQGSSAAWNLDEIHNLKLNPLEKADLLVATRKYDRAIEFMEGQLKSPEFIKTHAFDFESMLRRYLAVVIRVEKAPERALSGLNAILEKGEAPRYLLDQAQAWRGSLKAWIKEGKQKPNNPQRLFSSVEQRLKRAENVQHYDKDHAGDVEYLRATALLHDGMKILKTPGEQARALYLLGKAYEVLDELGAWNLHESYYEACLLKEPKSNYAQKCYTRLEASLYMGYSGSSGTHLPPEEKERLRRLKEKLNNAL